MKTKLDLIDRLEEIRTKNNKNWMDLVRLAYKYAPLESAKIMIRIVQNDEKITTVMKELSE